MNSWTREERQRVGDADELEIASLREDGSLRKFVIIWVVKIGNDVVVRSVKGRDSWWFKGVQTRHAGRIKAGGVEKDVTFIEVGRERDAEIDAAYRAKYSYSPSSVARINDPKAQAATIRLVPRTAEST